MARVTPPRILESRLNDRSETNQEATAQSRTEFLFVSDPSGSSGRSVGSGHNPGVQSFIQRELHRKKAVIRLAKLRNEHHFPLGHPQPTQLDPFSGALLPVTKRQRFFLSYYFETYSTAAEINLTKWEPNRAWMIQVTLSDPVVFHSTLALAMMALLSPRSDGSHNNFSELGRTSEFYSELSSAVKLLNNRLSSKATATQAETIWAIVQLLALEMTKQDVTGIGAHIQGLQTLLWQRGGFETLPPLVQRALLWLLPKVAIICGTKLVVPFPQTELPASGATLAHIRSLVNPSLLTLGDAFYEPKYNSFLVAPDNSSIIQDLREVTFYGEMSADNDNTLTTSDIEDLDFKLHTVEYTMAFNLVQSGNLRSAQSFIAKGTLIALLLYIQISYASRIALSILPVLRTILVAELRKLLDAYGQQQRPTDTRSVYYDTVLWLLFFGAHHASKGSDTQKWFIEQIAATSESLDMWRWGEVRAILMRYFYLDRIYGPDFREIWDQALRIAAG